MQRTRAASQLVCPSCAYSNEGDALCCSMCGQVLQRATPPAPEEATPSVEAPPPPAPHGVPVAPRVSGPETLRMPGEESVAPILGLSRPLFFFAVGIPLALVVASGAFGQRFSWFFAALFHETGHTVAGIFFGLPSFPAISLHGHAATVHDPQQNILVVLIWAGLGYCAWHFRARRVLLVTFAIAAALYPLLAWTRAKEFFFLTGGHLGEIAFATICLCRAWTGGFTNGNVERSAYSMLGWLFVGMNVGLCWGLMTSAAARAKYASNGSFGLTNDYIRLAQDVMHTSLQSVALLMFVASLLPPAIALLWAKLRS